MKVHTLTTLLAAGVFFCGSPASAAHESILTQQAQTLATLAIEMEGTYLEDLRETHQHYRVSRAELRFRESLCQLASLAGQFRRAVDRYSTACELERSFDAMHEAFECAENSSSGVKVCTFVRGMMQQFKQAMICVEQAGFKMAPQRQPEFEHHHHHHDRHHHERLEGSNTGGIQFRVPLPQHHLPFIFRQPVR